MDNKLEIVVDALALDRGFIPGSTLAVNALAAPLPRKTAPARDAAREPTPAECHLLAATLHPQGIEGTCWLDKPMTVAYCERILRRATRQCPSTLHGE
jgi:hypothetical protein